MKGNGSAEEAGGCLQEASRSAASTQPSCCLALGAAEAKPICYRKGRGNVHISANRCTDVAFSVPSCNTTRSDKQDGKGKREPTTAIFSPSAILRQLKTLLLSGFRISSKSVCFTKENGICRQGRLSLKNAGRCGLTTPKGRS